MKWHIDPSKLVITNRLVHRAYRMGNCSVSEFTLNGLWHNPNNIPALVEVYDSGTWTQCYYIDGNLHRDNGPAWVRYRSTTDEVIELHYTKDNTRPNTKDNTRPMEYYDLCNS